MATNIYCPPDHRIALFIDGDSFSAAMRGLDAQVDYRKLLGFFRNQARLVRASYYAMVREEGYAPIKPLLDWLSYNGFSVMQKRAGNWAGPGGRSSWRGSFAIDLTVDALSITPSVETVVLAVGDGRYRALVEGIQQLGARALVLSTMSTNPPMVADELRRQADQFLEIADLLPTIALERR